MACLVRRRVGSARLLIEGAAFDQQATEGVQVASQDAQAQVAFQAQFATVAAAKTVLSSGHHASIQPSIQQHEVLEINSAKFDCKPIRWN